MGTTGTPALLGESEAPIQGMFKGSGSPLEVIYTTTMSASYATGGDTLARPADVRTGDVVGVEVLNPIPVIAGDRLYSWDGGTATPKIWALVISTGAQVANATDLSAVTLRVKVTYAR
jgi:hypothetical protein